MAFYLKYYVKMCFRSFKQLKRLKVHGAKFTTDDITKLK